MEKKKNFKKKSFTRFALQSECCNFNQWEHSNHIPGHVIYNPAYPYKFQLETTVFYFSLGIYPVVCQWCTKLTVFPANDCLYLKSKTENKLSMYFFQETDGNPLSLWQGHWGTTYIWYSECFYHLLWTCVLKVKRRNSIFRNVFKHLAMVQNWTFHFSPSSSCQLQWCVE